MICYNVTILSPRAPPVCRQMLPIETNVKRLLIKQTSNKTTAINPQIHVINQRAKNKHAHHHTLLNTHTSLFGRHHSRHYSRSLAARGAGRSRDGILLRNCPRMYIHSFVIVHVLMTSIDVLRLPCYTVS